MRIVFFGTPAFAVPTLEALLASDVVVAAVFAQPDRPRGRSKKPVACPVCETAGAAGLAVHTPERLHRASVEPLLASLAADAAVVTAYGKIFRPWVFDCFPLGLINVHPSLLPRHRGPAPVAGAILAGDAVTGVTIMPLDHGMDTGDILLQEAVDVGADETTGELEARLARVAPPLLLEGLAGRAAGTIAPRPQDDSRATVTRLLEKTDGSIDWSAPARAVHDRVRGVNPWPGGRTRYIDRELLVWRTALSPRPPAGPGVVDPEGKGRLHVGCGEGSVELVELQWPGRKRVSARDFLNGTRLAPGEVLG